MNRIDLFPRIHKVLEEVRKYRKGEREAGNLMSEMDSILSETLQAADVLREDAAKQKDGEAEYDQRVSSIANLYENAAATLHKDLLDLFKLPKINPEPKRKLFKV